MYFKRNKTTWKNKNMKISEKDMEVMWNILPEYFLYTQTLLSYTTSLHVIRVVYQKAQK